MNMHTDTAEQLEPFTLLDAVDQLGTVKALITLINMAASGLGDPQHENAIECGVTVILNEIDDIRDSLRALRVGGVK